MDLPQNGIISVMGPHAGENCETIFARKIKDIQETEITFWLINSFASRPGTVQKYCKRILQEQQNVFCLFVEPAQRGGAAPAVEAIQANAYSGDRGETWNNFPSGLSPVTGRIRQNSQNTCALVFDEIKTFEKDRPVVDLWKYARFQNNEHHGQAIRFRQGCSTICAFDKDTRTAPERMRCRFRGVLAIARLSDPFGVWLA
ncbi:MAG: hypothetical protein U9R40_05940 [Synergistota bacterium]|nr:hypothetical protein [Synergistota bacterium]